MTPQQIIQRICPNLFADAGMNDYVTMASGQIGPSIWGADFNMGVALLASHNYSLDARPFGAPGAISEMREAQQSMQFGKQAPSAGGDDLDHSSYGLRFKRLRRSVIGPAVLTNGMKPTFYDESQPQEFS